MRKVNVEEKLFDKHVTLYLAHQADNRVNLHDINIGENVLVKYRQYDNTYWLSRVKDVRPFMKDDNTLGSNVGFVFENMNDLQVHFIDWEQSEDKTAIMMQNQSGVDVVVPLFDREQIRAFGSHLDNSDQGGDCGMPYENEYIENFILGVSDTERHVYVVSCNDKIGLLADKELCQIKVQ